MRALGTIAVGVVAVYDVPAVPSDDFVGSDASHFFEGELAVGASVVGLVVCGPSDDRRDALVGPAVVVRLVDVRHGCSVLLCLCQ